MSEMHTVEQGEYVSSIALDFGFSDWRTIYNHPQNADFRKKRPNPDVLLPGDQLFIPDKEEKKESCSTDEKHRFQLKMPKAWLKIVLKDADGQTFANQPYTLEVGKLAYNGGPERAYKGITDGNGLLQQEIPIGLDHGELKLPKAGITCNLKIGHLDPVHNEGDDAAIISGVKARLNNMGYYCGQVDGDLAPQTIEALKAFQRAALGRSDPDGKPDKQTRDALRQQHGS